MEPTYLDVREAAQFLRISRSRLYQLTTSGRIPTHQLCGHGKLLFTKEELAGVLIKRGPIARQKAGE
jgi:excisionase family DNA binding protein